MIRQHIFAIVHASAAGALTSIADQPTGEFVTVVGNDGIEHQVEELHGGFAYIGQRDAWIMVLASGIDAGFDAMRQVVPAGSVVELAVLAEGWPELDEAPDVNKAIALDEWIAVNVDGGDLANSATWNTTNRTMIEAVGGLFLDDFTINSVYVD